MKRLGLAVACALVLHAGLFWIGSGWSIRGSVPPSVSRSVTVTMSYRKEPVHTAVIHKETVKPPDISGPSKPKAPARLPEKTTLPRAVRPEKNNVASRTQQDQVTDAGTVTDDSRANKTSKKESAGEGAFVREAVPLYKINPPPRYPAAARRRGAQGTVILSVHVDEQGRVSDLWLFETSGHISLDTAAIEAVTGWRFEPGMQGGRNVAMWVRIPVRFELQ